MIIDNIKNLDLYSKSDVYTNKINEFINKSKESNLQEGRYELEGDNLIALIQKYETKEIEKCKYESHKKYIDVQYIEQGREVISWIDISKLEVDEPYNVKDDIIFYKDNLNGINLKMEEDMFAIFYEQDGHKVRSILEEKTNIKKIIFKIKK